MHPDGCARWLLKLRNAGCYTTKDKQWINVTKLAYQVPRESLNEYCIRGDGIVTVS